MRRIIRAAELAPAAAGQTYIPAYKPRVLPVQTVTKSFIAGAVFGLGAVVAVGVAQSPSKTTPAGDGSELDTSMLYEMYPGTRSGELRQSPSGLWEVNQGDAFGYVTSDGRYMIQGDLIDLKTGESLTEARRDDVRRSLLADIGPQNMIVFPPPKGTPTKHVVNVFTDTTCGYCRKMHQEMADYHAQGIEVRYLFYPRRGPGSEPFKTAESVWCADNRNAAMTAAKANRPVPPKSCANPVMQHYIAGQRSGLRGTPMMVLEDGTSISGYLPAKALAQRIAAAGL